MTDWLHIDNLTHEFNGRRVIDGLCLRVDERSPILGIVGPSGIGKSTLLRVIAGHLAASSGSVVVANEVVRGPSRDRPMVFQDHNLFPWMTVIDNVSFGLKCSGVAREERHQRGRALLAKLRMHPSTQGLYPAQLSGGMQQRVGLARALAVKPTCILMDEPFSALDGEMREELCEQISLLAASDRTRFAFVTHDLADAAFLADIVLVFEPSGKARILELDAMPHPRDRSLRFTSKGIERILRLRAALGFRAAGMEVIENDVSTPQSPRVRV